MAASLPKWLPMLGLDQTEASNLELHPGLTCDCRGPSTWIVTLCCFLRYPLLPRLGPMPRCNACLQTVVLLTCCTTSASLYLNNTEPATCFTYTIYSFMFYIFLICIFLILFPVFNSPLLFDVFSVTVKFSHSLIIHRI